MALFCFPLLPELLKVTSMDPDSPGAIGSFDQLGTEEFDVEIKDSDIRKDTYCSSTLWRDHLLS